MSGSLWAIVLGVAVVTFVIKAVGPATLGGRDLPPRLAGVVGLVAPALLTALVVTAALADGEELAIGADTAGVAVAGLAIWRGAPVIVGAVLAAGITAALRAL